MNGFGTRVWGIAAAAAVAVPLAFSAGTARAVPVGLELSLLIDVSGSVSGSEYDLQKGGYEAAFRSAAVQNAILNSAAGSIAVNFVQWSSAGLQVESVGYTLIDSFATADAFADALAAVARPFNGGTAPGSAIAFATPLFASNGFEAPRQVIDVSGDGVKNEGLDTATARDAALAAGVDTINGLAIGGASILAFYQAEVVGGTNAFAIGVNDFADFADAIQNKLVREITPVPEPATLAIFGAGLAALGLARRRRRGPAAAA